MIVIVEKYSAGTGYKYRYHRCDTASEAKDYEHALNQSDTTICTWKMEPLDALAFAIEMRLDQEWPNMNAEGWSSDAARMIIREELDRAGVRIRR